MSMSEQMERAADQRDFTIGDSITGRSKFIDLVRHRATALVPLRVAVLAQGESGSGRRHLLHTIFRLGNAQRECFTTLMPSDPGLDRPIANRNTVLLCEVDRTTPQQQSRWHELMKRSEQGQDDAPRRVFATTSRDLRIEAKAGRFDEALAATLLRFVLEIPPLRQRRTDISDLCIALGRSAGFRLRKTSIEFTPGALSLLSGQAWPGNTAELSATVEKLVAFCPDLRVTRAQVREVLEEAPGGVSISRRRQKSHQRDELVSLIDETGGNLAEVARRLGMSRGGVIYRAQKYGLLPSRSR